ncbi:MULTISPECIES: hypothetical protein [Aeromonas]|uniref:Lipoprotein n=1 Tax=Aeromonas enteropelogenes TaxID=29489 RepID=A0ABU9J6F0_AEREN|nr:hypothetical protein [Aeromonas enteropelogenes]MCZ0750099.1 hypothetical protein [Aeromonas enteropelogenes]
MVLIERVFNPRSVYTAAILGVVLLISGCTVKLISSYDEATDKAVTALQKKTETYFVSLEAVEGLPECVYEKHKDFYNEAKVDVAAIAVRAAAIPKNEITTQQAELLSSNLNTLEKLHKIACLSQDQISLLRTQFNSSFTAILKLELAKRRGE